VDGGGSDIWGTSDKFHFVYQAVSGDVDIVARVDSITQADEWSKSGVMIRASLNANSAHAFALVSAAKGVAFQRRRAAGGQSTNTAGATVRAPYWVRLVRSGTTVTAYVSSNGTSWTRLGSDTIALGTSAYVGIATTSHNSSSTTSADVSRVILSKSSDASALPSGQIDADIGSPSIRGSASYSSGTYTISAGGTDIWNTADQFNYVYKQVTGDVDVKARVASLTNTDIWAKAGVMIRGSLGAGAKHASMFLTAGEGYAFQRRPSTGGVSENTGGGSGQAPGWVRIKRAGSLFTAYKSTDGQTWTVVGSDSISMSSTVLVGIAVTSHNPSSATRASVTNFAATTNGSTNQPPTVSLTAPSGGAKFTTGATISLAATASDPEGNLAKVEFYRGSTLIRTDTSSPFTASWTNAAAGSFSLTAVAYDTAGLKTTSAAVAVTVSTATTGAPRYVAFQKSADHATLVTSYKLNVYASGANPATATPVKSVSLGKPTPDSSGNIQVDEQSFFNALAAGNYIATVAAVGTGGSTQSSAVTFSR
jgi:regulation of enolase protein 1 (concanavalin A-like superfamily)